MCITCYYILCYIIYYIILYYITHKISKLYFMSPIMPRTLKSLNERENRKKIVDNGKNQQQTIEEST